MITYALAAALAAIVLWFVVRPVLIGLLVVLWSDEL